VPLASAFSIKSIRPQQPIFKRKAYAGLTGKCVRAKYQTVFRFALLQCVKRTAFRIRMRLNTLLVIAISVLLLTLAAAPARAQGYEASEVSDDAISFAVADVLRADPIYELVQEARPREVCRDNTSVQDRKYDNTAAGTIVGAVVGAAIGNQVGHGNGRAAATAAGAVAGGAIGREVDASNNPQGQRRTTRTDCEVVDEYIERRQIVGYDVQYRYRGEVYVSRLSYDPGEKLRVRVSVAPAEL
jgi:uncharacterized protein YcfJ